MTYEPLDEEEHRRVNRAFLKTGGLFLVLLIGLFVGFVIYVLNMGARITGSH